MKPITGEDLLALGDIGPSELIDGRIVTMTPTGDEHGTIEFNLGSELRPSCVSSAWGGVTAARLASTRGAIRIACAPPTSPSSRRAAWRSRSRAI
ncbi:MAG: Uma2 family endonuclease [Anaerolineae bacterium]|nr:Uma2 family endonuclease [Anaerolineae bacterium]